MHKTRGSQVVQLDNGCNTCRCMWCTYGQERGGVGRRGKQSKGGRECEGQGDKGREGGRRGS